MALNQVLRSLFHHARPYKVTKSSLCLKMKASDCLKTQLLAKQSCFFSYLVRRPDDLVCKTSRSFPACNVSPSGISGHINRREWTVPVVIQVEKPLKGGCWAAAVMEDDTGGDLLSTMAVTAQ